MLALHSTAANFAMHVKLYAGFNNEYISRSLPAVTDRNELEAAQKFLEQAAVENLVSFVPPGTYAS